MVPSSENAAKGSTDSSSTSRSLIDRLKANDEAGWRRFVDLYGPLIYHWCRQSNFSAADSADAVQEVLRKVARSIHTYGKGRAGSSFRAWLWTITRNTIRDHIRNTAKQPAARGGSTALEEVHRLAAPVELSDDERTGEAAASDLARRAIELIRTEFNDATWRAFELMIFYERDASQAAAEVGMTPQAVRKAKSRILRRVREELGNE